MQFFLELENTVGRLRRHARKQQQRIRRLADLAFRDELTGLRNRRAMKSLAKTEVRRHVRDASPLALGLLDVDKFKEANTKHLHPGADHALGVLSRMMTDSLRADDLFVGRWGGDEFLLLMRSDLQGTQVLAERIRALIEATPIPYAGATIRLTASLGFAVAEECSRSVDFKRLEFASARALHDAKSAGGNSCIVRRLEDLPDAPVPGGNLPRTDGET
jgi:diguanylate cyclase (GGDEF)-like protein